MGVTEVPADEYEILGMRWLTENRNKIAAKTTGRRLTSLRAFAKWAKWDATFEEYTAPTPLRGTPHPLPEGIEGVKKMIEVANKPQHKALVALCGLCGLRVAEALSVSCTDFDFPNMILTIRGKGDVARQVPISPYAWEVLRQPVMQSFVEKRTVVNLHDRFARALITALGERAGLKRHVASHDLRATFATEVYNKTLDMRLVQRLLGHANGVTTEMYVGRSAEQLANGVDL